MVAVDIGRDGTFARQDATRPRGTPPRPAPLAVPTLVAPARPVQVVREDAGVAWGAVTAVAAGLAAPPGLATTCVPAKRRPGRLGHRLVPAVAGHARPVAQVRVVDAPPRPTASVVFRKVENDAP